MDTEFGRIARMLQTVETGRTPLQENLDRVGHSLAKATFVVVAIIVGLGLVRGQPFIEMFIFGIALAVAVVPEALPAVVTISLAIGVQRMVKRHALMRRLPAVETLGSTSVICSDKTGTLTKDEMTVRGVFVGGRTARGDGRGLRAAGSFLRDGKPVEPSDSLRKLLTAATLASDARVVHDAADGRWHVKGDPTEGALVVAAAKAGLHKADLDARWPRVGEIPFTSETKRMTTLHDGPEGTVACAQGRTRGDPRRLHPPVDAVRCTCLLDAAGTRGRADSRPRHGRACAAGAGGGVEGDIPPRGCRARDDVARTRRDDRSAAARGAGSHRARASRPESGSS